MADNNSSLILETALKKIPELYQPIFGHPEYDGKASRICTDRLKYIRKVYDALSKKLNRPLNVLEFGCNSGFMSLTMASWGAKVVALDSNLALTDIWEVLAEENLELDVTFFPMNLEDFPLDDSIVEKYDLILCLGVLHKLCSLYDVRSVEKMLTVLSKKVTAGIFELALRTEPANWARALPEDYRDFLSGFSCVKLLAYNETLNNQKRPLVFASNEYVYFEKIGMLKINPEDYPEDYVPQFQRRYFFCEDKFVKGARIFLSRENPKHFIEFQRESQFLQKWGGLSDFPKLYASDICENEIEREIWIAREKIEGTPLSIALKNGDCDGRDMAKQILKHLIFLEEIGYYHSDPQFLGNFLYNKEQNKIFLIDYGSFRDRANDCFEIIKSVYAFFGTLIQLFRNEVDTKIAKQIEAIIGTIDLKPYLTPKQYEKLLSLEVDDKFFSNLYKILFSKGDDIKIKTNYTLRDYELLRLENLIEGARNDRQQNYLQFSSTLSHHAQVINQMADSINLLNRAIAYQQKQIAALEKKLSKTESN